MPDVTNSRKPHRKSRTGCLQCKRRRVKCDERRPGCAKCAAAGGDCLYPLRPWLRIKSAVSTTLATQDNARLLLLSPAILASLIGVAVPPCLTTAQRILFHHIATKRDEVLGSINSGTILSVAIRNSTTTPYLLLQLLALSALHVVRSSNEPSNYTMYQYQSMLLQNASIASFCKSGDMLQRSCQLDVDARIAAFYFTGVLNLHAMVVSLPNLGQQPELGTFIDSFVTVMRLCRGARLYLLPHNAAPHSLHHDMRPIPDSGETNHSQRLLLNCECGLLERLFDMRDVHGSPHIASCRLMARQLQWAFDLNSKLCDMAGAAGYYGPYAAGAFTITATDAYTAALREHRAEALVVLAYYGVLLYRCRGFWAYGSAGASIVTMVSRHLGSMWQEWLSWPCGMVKDDLVAAKVAKSTSAKLAM